MVWLEKKPGPAAGGLVAGDPSARSAASEAIRFQRKLGLAPVPPGTLSLLSHDPTLTPLAIRELLANEQALVHLTVEIHPCDTCR